MPKVDLTLPPMRPLMYQPHQKSLRRHLPEMKFPFYICWGMGSGKTIGGCLCMQLLQPEQRVLVLCDKSTVTQWVREVERVFRCNGKEFAPCLAITVEHYESLDKEDALTPSDFDMVIVDEAHRFRNAWIRNSTRMLYWIEQICLCGKVIYLSGTPLVHDAAIDMDAFRRMMLCTSKYPLETRISMYDPRLDTANSHHYAHIEDHEVQCNMTWAQCFKYLISRRQTFEMRLEGEVMPRSRTSSTRNTYNTALRSIANCPFPEIEGSSPKIVRILGNMTDEFAQKKKQIVYSSRKDTGVYALRRGWSRASVNKRTYAIDGSMSQTERVYAMNRFNNTPGSVLFITDAAAQGIDLKRVDIVHIMEPGDNVQEERQVINRAVRFKSHRLKNAIVNVYRYIILFPVSATVAAPWKNELFQSGMFDRNEMKGLTRRVQYALLDIIRKEENMMTIDERTLYKRELHNCEICKQLVQLQTLSIECRNQIKHPTSKPLEK